MGSNRYDHCEKSVPVGLVFDWYPIDHWGPDPMDHPYVFGSRHRIGIVAGPSYGWTDQHSPFGAIDILQEPWVLA